MELEPVKHHLIPTPERILLIQPQVGEGRYSWEALRLIIGLGAQYVEVGRFFNLKLVHSPVRAACQIALVPVEPRRVIVQPVRQVVNGADELLLALLDLVVRYQLDLYWCIDLHEIQAHGIGLLGKNTYGVLDITLISEPPHRLQAEAHRKFVDLQRDFLAE